MEICKSSPSEPLWSFCLREAAKALYVSLETVADADSFSGNQLKMLIKRLDKDMANDLEEKVVQGETSKGLHFYQAIYLYPKLVGLTSPTVSASSEKFLKIYHIKKRKKVVSLHRK